MSAFSVSDKHINVLLAYAQTKTKRLYAGREALTLNAPELARLGQVLRDANNTSLAHRYGDAGDTYEYQIESSQTYSPADIIQLARCFEYQACEYPDWYVSQAREIIIAIERLAIDEGVSQPSTLWTI